MPITPRMTVVFRVAAGPRIGFGHLVRCRSLARALGVPPVVSVRGGATTRARAQRLGWTVVDPASDPFARRPDLLVVDDPRVDRAAPWVARARRHGVPVAALCDAGLPAPDADLIVDGGVVARPGHARTLAGPEVVVLDPHVAAVRRRRPRRVPGRVLVALGGGAHVVAAARPIAARLTAAVPGLEVHIAGGFTRRRVPLPPGAAWLHRPAGLADDLALAAVAVVAGGLTAFEACALGTPAIAVAVVPSQRRTVAALAARGTVVGQTASLRSAAACDALAAQVVALLADRLRQRRLSAAGRHLIDGRGARRVAAALTRLASRQEVPHAA
jgi:UDP-2,4-diacetamido-2,4,6-trideoxy-beta-L-altropyranose hydrolase